MGRTRSSLPAPTARNPWSTATAPLRRDRVGQHHTAEGATLEVGHVQAVGPGAQKMAVCLREPERAGSTRKGPDPLGGQIVDIHAFGRTHENLATRPLQPGDLVVGESFDLVTLDQTRVALSCTNSPLAAVPTKVRPATRRSEVGSSTCGNFHSRRISPVSGEISRREVVVAHQSAPPWAKTARAPPSNAGTGATEPSAETTVLCRCRPASETIQRSGPVQASDRIRPWRRTRSPGWRSADPAGDPPPPRLLATILPPLRRPRWPSRSPTRTADSETG